MNENNTALVVRSRAPVRIDFAGGWTDVALFAEQESGAVVNAAINVHSYVSVQKLPSQKVQSNAYGYKHVEEKEDKSVRIYSADFDVYQEADEIRELEYNGRADLVKAALRRSEVDFGVQLVTRCDAPVGSGLGTSGSMSVALLGALARLNGDSFLSYEIAELASALEREELGILGGKQDQYAAALGGFSFMEFFGEDVRASKINVSDDVVCELEKNMLLCYTGKSRVSGDIHQTVVDAYLNQEKRTLEALESLKRIALDMKDALLQGNLRSFGSLLLENWENQKKLHPSVTNEQIDSLFEMALNNGAIGGKAGGAGGGGCIVFYCEPDKEHVLRKELEAAGTTIIDFGFDFDGLRVWYA